MSTYSQNIAGILRFNKENNGGGERADVKLNKTGGMGGGGVEDEPKILSEILHLHCPKYQKGQ